MASERRPATTLLHVEGRPVAIRIGGFELEALSGPAAGQKRRCEKRSMLFGSHASADVVLVDTTVSRLHARLDVEENDYVLRDLGSTNGTRVGGIRIREACLEDGVVFELGASRLRFRIAGEPFQLTLAEVEELEGMFGRSVPMRELFAACARVAPSDASVIIQGETGTGKELVARALHQRSPRRSKPLVVLDCGAIPPTLVEAELFGHERGAFTGAHAARPGVFERADGGTLFLDELGELPIEHQPKLLRALETGEVTRIGGERPIRVDVRVIAATHRDLPRMVVEGRFRTDLYYRLAVIRLSVPALRERREDIPLLATHFAQQAMADTNLSREILEALSGDLTRYDWPGNVRQLRNVIERAAILADARVLRESTTEEAAGELRRSFEHAVVNQVPMRAARAEMEREYLTSLVRGTEGNLDEAARIAQIHRKSLERLLRRYKLRTAGSK
jgi:DNA-binding NtrC family response regulator